jgi:hypothetical protein
MERVVWILIYILNIAHVTDASVQDIGGGTDGDNSDTDLGIQHGGVGSGEEDYDSLLLKWGKPFRDDSAVITPDEHGNPRLMMFPSSWVKDHLCPEKLWSSLKLVSSVYLMTAGAIQIGTGESKVEFIHLLPQSNYLHVPKKAFHEIVQKVPQHTGLNLHTAREGIKIKKSEIGGLPSIKIQFAETNVVYELTPSAYTNCKDGDDNDCEVMVKLAVLGSGYWYLGKPFFNNVVSAISMGNIKKAFVHVCPPKKQVVLNTRVKFYTTDVKVGMPWTPSDYTLLAMVVLFVTGGILYIFRDKLTCFTRRSRGERLGSEDDRQPLLTNN